MPYVNNKQYEEYLKYLKKKDNGRNGMDENFLRFVCSAHNYNAEEIGKYFLDMLAQINSKKR